ncbi:MAG: PKD domain-containing protein [Bacteroidota bacterium]
MAIALLLVAAWLPSGASAQCTPDLNFVSADQRPKTWKTGCVGQPYDETVFITFPIDSVINGINVVFDHFEVLSTTLPAGLNYTCNVTNCKWDPTNTPTSQELMFGCIQISGTPTAPFNGQVTFDIEGCVTVIIVTQCETEIIPFDLTIVDPPNALFDAAVNMNTVMFSDQTTGGPITTWNWDFADGGTSSLQNPSHVYANPGTYDVCLDVVSADGCTRTYCKEVEIITVSADPAEVFASAIDMYPNPAAGRVQLKMDGVTRPVIELRSLDGRKVREWNFAGGPSLSEETLDLEGIAGGLYFLNIQAKEGSLVRRLAIGTK